MVTTIATAIAAVVASTPAGAHSQPDTETMRAPEPALQVEQLAEPDVHIGRTQVTGAAPRMVCQRGATWLRLRFAALSLHGNDSVTLAGTAGGAVTLTAKHWPGRAFHTRALPGDCVQISPRLADPASTWSVDAYQAGTQSLTAATVTVAAVGDICGSSCDQTAAVVRNMSPTALILAGDNAYESGTLSEYRNNYDPHYGQFKSITFPSPGNHEYQTAGAAGYFDYFGTRAGERGKGYYSFDVGDWHLIALNDNISTSTGSAQEQWLRADLAANTKPCTGAFWHSPRFSRGSHGDDTSVRPLFQALFDHRADLVIVGHDHNYQRFAPSRPDGTRDDANGIRQFVIGTGGRGFYGFDQSSAAVQEVGNTNTFGVGRLTLSATGYRADFVPVAGRTFTDTVSGTCHKANTSPDFSVTANPTALTVPQGGTGAARVSVASLNGFASATTLSVSGLPAGVQGSLAPNPVTPPANGAAESTLTLTASATAGTGTANVTITGSANGITRTATLRLTISGSGSPVFADGFETDAGWTANPSGVDTATTGRWERGDPEQTVSDFSNQIKQRGDTTSGVNCLSTGRLAGSSYGANDVDGGLTSIRSPQISIPATGTSRLTFQFTYAHGNNATSADFLRVKVIDGTAATTVFERLGAATERAGVWQAATGIDLTRFAGRNVHLLVESADAATASLWESAIDDVRIDNG